MASFTLQRIAPSICGSIRMQLQPNRRVLLNQTPHRTIFAICKKSVCAKAETGNCICKNMRDAREKLGEKSKVATQRTKVFFGRVGGFILKSWRAPLRTLEYGRPGKRDPLGLFDGSSEKQQLEKAKKVFAAIDYDGTGFVSAHELRMGLKEVFGYEATEEQVKKMMAEADTNGDNVIQLEEFLLVVSAFRAEIEERAVETEARMAAQDSARF